MSESTALIIAAILAGIIYKNHISIMKKINDEEEILGNTILGIILVIIFSALVLTLCTLH